MPKRLSLTKEQAEVGIGLDLLQLLQGITADGRITDQEIQALREWLHVNRKANLTAIGHLRDVVDRVLGDGVISPEERKQLQGQIEAVLPTGERPEAKALRKQAVAEDRIRDTPIGVLDCMVAGVGYDNRQVVIRRFAREGARVFLFRDPGNRFSPNATLVKLQNGLPIGYVPEADAVDLAPMLDGGCRQEMVIKKILSGRRGLIPVIRGNLYDARSPLGLRVDPALAQAACKQRPGCIGLLACLFLIVTATLALAEPTSTPAPTPAPAEAQVEGAAETAKPTPASLYRPGVEPPGAGKPKVSLHAATPTPVATPEGLAALAARVKLQKSGSGAATITDKDVAHTSGTFNQSGATSPAVYLDVGAARLDAEEHCKEEWAKEFSMQLHCVRQEHAAIDALSDRTLLPGIPAETFATIRRECQDDWPHEYSMRNHCETREIESFRKLKEGKP